MQLFLFTGTHDKTCHWCNYKSSPSPETNRRTWGDFRRWLDEDHAFRQSGRHGDEETRDAPALRTHDQFVDDAHRQMSYTGFKKYAPYRTSGVKELSPLHLLPMFDMVWDVLPDCMHTLAGWVQSHIFPLMKTGDHGRRPAKPKERKSWTTAENKALLAAHKEVIKQIQSWEIGKVFF
jgi:hypothetical protein